MKTSAFSLLLGTRENIDIVNTFGEIYLVFASESEYSLIKVSHYHVLWIKKYNKYLKMMIQRFPESHMNVYFSGIIDRSYIPSVCVASNAFISIILYIVSEFSLTPNLEYFTPTFCLWLQIFAKSQ